MCAYNERETLGLEGVSFHLTCTNRTKVGREMGSRLGAGNEPHNGPRTDALAMSSNQKSSVRDRKHRHAHSTQNTVGKKKKKKKKRTTKIVLLDVVEFRTGLRGQPPVVLG